MKTNIVHLTDGTTMRVNVNFATWYHMQKIGLTKKMQKIEKDREDGKEIDEDEAMEISAQMIYVIMRSNGKDVTFDEALCLAPADTEEIQNAFNDFERKLKEFKKKQDAKQRMRNQMGKK